MVLEACVLSLDGTEYLRKRATAPAAKAQQMGRDLAQEMLEAGADKILRLVGREIGER
jgi:porphobilinogen deaminase